MSNHIACPVCHGTGKIDPPVKTTKKDKDDSLPAAAMALREAGYTIREIATLLGFKHPGSISYLLDKEKDKDKDYEQLSISPGPGTGL